MHPFENDTKFKLEKSWGVVESQCHMQILSWLSSKNPWDDNFMTSLQELGGAFKITPPHTKNLWRFHSWHVKALEKIIRYCSNTYKKNWKVIYHYFSVSPTPIFWVLTSRWNVQGIRWHLMSTDTGDTCHACYAKLRAHRLLRWHFCWPGLGSAPHPQQLWRCWETVQFRVFLLKENKENWPF